MIIVQLMGGLGNQMFQYALGRHLAMRHNVPLKLDLQGFKDYKIRNYDLNHFNIQENIATSRDLSRVFFPFDGRFHTLGKILKVKLTGVQQIQYIKQRTLDFQPEILSLDDNIYLDGSWQSEKYFSDITDVIKKEFTVKSNPDSLNNSYLNEITGCESVSVHIRRGDYISNPKTNQFHGTLDLEYYQDALKLVLEKMDDPHFFVFSDDPDWAEHHIILSAPVTYIRHNTEKNFEDMRLMSSCKHHIIANSSFSWWGAWLASNKNKVVIGPKKWFREMNYCDEDRMPDNWIRI